MNIVSYQMFMVVLRTTTPSVHDIDGQKVEKIKGFKHIKSDIRGNSYFMAQQVHSVVLNISNRLSILLSK